MAIAEFISIQESLKSANTGATPFQLSRKIPVLPAGEGCGTDSQRPAGISIDDRHHSADALAAGVTFYFEP